MTRQLLIAAHVFAHATCDWLTHVDTDEYLIRMPQIARFLATRPAEVMAVTVPNAERVEWRGAPADHVFGGVFRKSFPHGATTRVAHFYGDAEQYLYCGLSGYAVGKSFYRVGADIRPGIHQPVPREDWLTNPARQFFPRVGLVHFETWSQAHWQRKLVGRVVNGQMPDRFNPRRRNQIAAAYARRDDPAALQALYDDTRTLSYGMALRLGLARKLLPHRFDIAPALRAHWPGQEIDLTKAAINRAMGLDGAG